MAGPDGAVAGVAGPDVLDADGAGHVDEEDVTAVVGEVEVMQIDVVGVVNDQGDLAGEACAMSCSDDDVGTAHRQLGRLVRVGEERARWRRRCGGRRGRCGRRAGGGSVVVVGAAVVVVALAWWSSRPRGGRGDDVAGPAPVQLVLVTIGESVLGCLALAPATEMPVLSTSAVATKYIQFARFIRTVPLDGRPGTERVPRKQRLVSTRRDRRP